MDEKHLQEVKLARPLAILDLWDIDDRIDRLEDVANRLQKITESLIELYRTERVKGWEMILNGMLKKEETKKGDRDGNGTG